LNAWTGGLAYRAVGGLRKGGRQDRVAQLAPIGTLPLAESVLQVLRLWRENTARRSDEDWTFANPHYHGQTPYSYGLA
jgi:hypothetical protein